MVRRLPDYRNYIHTMSNKVHSIKFLGEIATLYSSDKPVEEIVKVTGASWNRIRAMMNHYGIKRGVEPTRWRWELVQGQEVFTAPFYSLSSSHVHVRMSRTAKREVKKNLNPQIEHQLYLVMNSKANTTQEPRKLTPTEAKNQIAVILESMDRHTETTVGGYARISALVDNVATGASPDHYKAFGGHTKEESLCWQNAAPDEPVFVLRAQDKTAPVTIMNWIQLNVNNPLMPDAKLAEAFDTALAMRGWRERKFPD